VVRQRPLYYNCLLLAPDGQELCTCDIRKAEWYIDKGLAGIQEFDNFMLALYVQSCNFARSLENKIEAFMNDKFLVWLSERLDFLWPCRLLSRDPTRNSGAWVGIPSHIFVLPVTF
jgi:hypothetical protein